ncbi:hypothetical protein DF185_05465 [Marinifilum breve]|uniref:Uncharacterized protein n=1 Tax=Marinifilum breve TaxID=2184082 RepID=A0A2V4ADI6_9BACT|nr:hypothetical protein [Marinifilum breve]PXY02094.1 hypothetical protein DF185_05465 [Marinifilum breve]
MQLLIILLFILAFASFALHITLIKRWLVQFVILAVLGLGFYFAYPYAIEQSYTSFRTTIDNQQIVSNFLVLQIIECIMGLLFCIFLIRDFYKERTIAIFRYFKLFPGIVILPALFYAENIVFITIHGLNFQFLAVLIAIIVPLFIFGLIKLISWLIPEYDLRLELKFILHILQLVLSVVISVKLFALPVNSSVGEMNYIPLTVLLVLLLVMGRIGVYLHHRKMNKLIKSKL